MQFVEVLVIEVPNSSEIGTGKKLIPNEILLSRLSFFFEYSLVPICHVKYGDKLESIPSR